MTRGGTTEMVAAPRMMSKGKLPECEAHLRRYAVARRSQQGLKVAGLGHPAVLAVVIETERVSTDGNRHIAALAGLQVHFLEAF